MTNDISYLSFAERSSREEPEHGSGRKHGKHTPTRQAKKTADAPKRCNVILFNRSVVRSFGKERRFRCPFFTKFLVGKFQQKEEGRKEEKGDEKVDQNPFPTVFAQFCSG